MILQKNQKLEKEKRKLVKLYNVPNDSIIDIEHLGIKERGSKEIIKTLEFKHIDGSYSLCYHKGYPVHIKAWTEVYIINTKNLKK